jgi:hypothetical protein
VTEPPNASDGLPLLFTVPEWIAYLATRPGGGDPTPDELETIMARIGRNHSPTLLADLYVEGWLTDAAASRCVPTAWSMCEYPQDALSNETWQELFYLAGYTVDGQPAKRPETPLRLYRGSAERFRDRWSWTDDQTSAERFATGLRTRLPGRVWVATVEPWRLFCRIHEHSRRESEYVLDTAGLAIEAVAR